MKGLTNRWLQKISSVIAGAGMALIGVSFLYAEGGTNNPEVTVMPTSWTVTEGNSGYKTQQFTLRISKCPAYAPIKIKVYTANDSAKSGSDYIAVNQTFTFDASPTCTQSYSITVKIKGDTIYEGTERFWLKLTDAGTDTGVQGYTLETDKVPIVINNDDTNPNANIKITKTNDTAGKKVNAGREVTYTIKASNDGPQPTKLKVVDEFRQNDKSHVTFVSVTDDSNDFSCAYDASAKKIRCEGNRVFNPGESVTITSKYIINDTLRDKLRNTAKVFSVPQKPDSNKNNNSAYSDVRTNTYNARVDKAIKTNGGWSGTARYDIGDTVEYRLKIYNTDPQPTRLTLTDTLPSGVRLQSVTVSGVPDFSCSVDTASNRFECSGNYRFRDKDKYPSDIATVYVTAMAVSEGRFYNRARVEGQNDLRGTDRWSSNIRADIGAIAVNDRIVRHKSVSSPTNADGNYYVGDEVTFTLRGRNYGTSQRVRIRDWLPPTGSGKRNGTTRGAFQYISVTPSSGVPMSCQFHNSTNKNHVYVTCTSDRPAADNEVFEVKLKVKLKKAGSVCNRAYFYKEYDQSGTPGFFSRGSDEVCFQVKTPKQPPVLNIPNMTKTVDVPFTIDLKNYTTDPDSGRSDFTYTLNNSSDLPNGLTFDSDGTISGTYTGTTQNFELNITVTDEVGLSDTDTFVLSFTYPSLEARNNYYEIAPGDTIASNMITEATTQGGNTYLPDEGNGLTAVNVTYNASLSLNPVTSPQILWQSDGSFTFIAPSEIGLVVFDYTIEDKYGRQDSAKIYINVVYPTIYASNDKYIVPRNVSVSGNVLTDETESGEGADNGVDIRLVNHTNPLHGTLTIQSDGNFTYVPETNYVGVDTFQYTIKDAYDQEANATVRFEVGEITAEGYTDFYLVNPPETRNIIGNFLMTGNTVMCITDKNGTEPDAFTGNCIDSTGLYNNKHMVKYIDIDGNDTVASQQTWNSSSAQFTLPPSLDTLNGNGILWAGLYWQGSINNSTGVYNKQRRAGLLYGMPYGYKYITSDEYVDFRAEGAGTVLVRIDNENTYEAISADAFYYDKTHGNYGGYYAAFANITSWLRSKNLGRGDHTITVANIVSNEGREDNVGNYAGWTLVVIYRESFESGKLRNISIYNGYQALGKGKFTYIPSKEFTISGFRLPRDTSKEVNAQIGVFAGEGEYYYGGQTDSTDYMYIRGADNTDRVIPTSHSGNIFDAQFDNIVRPAGNNNDLQHNTNGIDIDYYDVSSIMTDIRNANPSVASVSLGVVSIDNNESRRNTPNDQSDYVTLSMIAFSAELYQPELCYDYSYKQNGVTFTEENNGSQYPTIRADKLYSLSPVTVELYIRNNEESDAVLRDVKVDVYEINTTYGSYHPESVYVVEPKSAVAKHIPDSTLQTASEYVKGIPIGDINAKDFTYIDYSIDPAMQSDFEMPINVRLNMTLDLLSGVIYPINGYPLESMPICGDLNNSYGVEYGRFNVEDEGLSPKNDAPIFNLPTQVVRRIGRFAVRSYNVPDTTSPVALSTMVAVEVIDVEKYHDKVAACMEPDNHISPRIWIPFVDTTQSDPSTSYVTFNYNTINTAIGNGLTSAYLLQNESFTTPEEMFNVARRAAAFRIYYPVDANGTYSRIEPVSGGGWKIDDFSALRNGATQCTRAVLDVDTGNLSTSVDAVCDGVETGTSMQKIASCMECLLGQSTRYVCSRDMFAIRPKAYRVVLSDQDEATNASQEIVRNDTTDTTNIVAGYDYLVEVNATRYDDDNASAGYMVTFKENGENGERIFTFAWQEVTGHNDCNVKDDFNQTITFLDGYGKSDNTKARDIGEYLLRLKDKDYTRVDWDPDYRTHMNGQYFLQGYDCVPDSSAVTDKNELSQNTSGSIGNTNGCEIRSELDSDYTDLKLHLYPYGFAMDLSADRGPFDDNAGMRYIYVNSMPLWRSDNRRMSFNIYGSYRAIGKDGNTTRNFTEGCWGDDTQLLLSMTALKPDTAPSVRPNLSYALRDFNATDPDVAYRPTSGGDYERGFDAFNPHTGGTLVVEQGVTFYPKETEGQLGIELLINYDRSYNMPLNPRLIRFDDFNISYKTQPTDLHADMTGTYTIRSSMTIDKNATFIYGRAMPGLFFYDNITDDSVTTPIYIVAYCSLDITACTDAGLYSIADGMLRDAQSSESGWWVVQKHDGQREGNVTLVSTGGDVVPESPASPVIENGTAENVSVINTSGTVPTVVFINLNTTNSAPWLIYNRNVDSVPTPYYKVRFIGKGGWTGHGITGHVVGDDINPVKIRRLEW